MIPILAVEDPGPECERIASWRLECDPACPGVAPPLDPEPRSLRVEVPAGTRSVRLAGRCRGGAAVAWTCDTASGCRVRVEAEGAAPMWLATFPDPDAWLLEEPDDREEVAEQALSAFSDLLLAGLPGVDRAVGFGFALMSDPARAPDGTLTVRGAPEATDPRVRPAGSLLYEARPLDAGGAAVSLTVDWSQQRMILSHTWGPGGAGHVVVTATSAGERHDAVIRWGAEGLTKVYTWNGPWTADQVRVVHERTTRPSWP